MALRSRSLRLYISYVESVLLGNCSLFLLHLYCNGLPFKVPRLKKSKTPLSPVSTQYKFGLCPRSFATTKGIIHAEFTRSRSASLLFRTAGEMAFVWNQRLVFSFPLGTEMFHFPRLTPMHVCIRCMVSNASIRGVPPFGNLRIKGCLSPPRSLSQIATSFIV